jgi:polyketide cyclase/dehydrase/lipid transport protein
MARQEIEVVQDFNVPVDRLFEFMAEHENLSQVLPARIKRLRDGNTERNGVGSVRRMFMGGLMPLDEEVTAVEDNALIRYRVTSKGPIRNHQGTQRFSARDGGSRLSWSIAFDPVVPGTGKVIASGLELGLRRGLRSAARKL